MLMASPVRTPDRRDGDGSGAPRLIAIRIPQPPGRRITGVRHYSQLSTAHVVPQLVSVILSDRRSLVSHVAVNRVT